MNLSHCIVPAPTDSGFVALSGGSGTRFKKHILHRGPLRHPVTGKVIMVDDAFVGALKDNFARKVGGGIVQVPIVDSNNRHTEDPLRNIGEVVELTADGKGVYAIIDVRSPSGRPFSVGPFSALRPSSTSTPPTRAPGRRSVRPFSTWPLPTVRRSPISTPMRS